jgi:beta-lactamase regulating signal transducer with metallopeptidase domain
MHTLLIVGLGNAVAATVLAIVAWLAALRVRRPGVLHALWGLVLLKLVTPPLWPVAIPSPAITESHEVPGSDTMAEAVLPTPLAAASGEAAADVHPAAAWMPSGEALATTVWLTGSALWWGLATLRLRQFRRLLREAQPAPAEVLAMTGDLARRLGVRRCPQVWMLPAPVSPLLLAQGNRLYLLLPAELWPRFSAEQQRTLLAHELSHLRRRDHWVRRLEFVVLGLYWWLPVAWYARRRLQEAEEECCDALVVAALPDSAAAYAEALLETVSFLSSRPAPLPATASGAGAVPLLKRRLTMILRGDPKRQFSILGWAGLFAAVMLFPLWPTQADPPTEPAAVRPDTEAGDPPQPAPRALNEARDLLRHAGMEQGCMSCHQAASFHNLHKRTADPRWADLHREAVNLLGKLREGQGTGKRDQSEAIQAHQEEIELLQAQLEVKKAMLQAVEGNLRQAETRLRNYERVGRAISNDDLLSARAEVENLKAQAAVKRAEMLEPEVRLKHAQRRLAALRKTTDREADATSEQRLEKVERQLRRMLEELQSLQKELEKLRN